MAKRKAIGERGSWFATVDGDRLPCVHKHWVNGNHHNDPGYLEGEGQWPALLQAIKTGKRVILTKDEVLDAPEKKSGIAFNRLGYIAVFEVNDIEADDSGLRFELVRRICDLA